MPDAMTQVVQFNDLSKMTAPPFVDMSSWQPDSIDWKVYNEWSKQVDDKARVSIRATNGTELDTHYHEYKDGFLSAGGNEIFHYAYPYPNINEVISVADWFFNVVGDLHNRPQDIVMLDAEQDVPQATAEWFLHWLQRQEQHYRTNRISIYASQSYILSRLQLQQLAHYELILAKWEFNPNERPLCPPPWQKYLAIQYSDKVSVPGIGTKVDGDVFIGKDVFVPVNNDIFTSIDIELWQMMRTDIPHNTGIAKAWLLAHRKLNEIGPPLGLEKNAVQRFAGATAVWSHVTHLCSWFDARGKILL